MISAYVIAIYVKEMAEKKKKCFDTGKDVRPFYPVEKEKRI